MTLNYNIKLLNYYNYKFERLETEVSSIEFTKYDFHCDSVKNKKIEK